MEEITYNGTNGIFFTKEEFQQFQKNIVEQRELISQFQEMIK